MAGTWLSNQSAGRSFAQHSSESPWTFLAAHNCPRDSTACPFRPPTLNQQAGPGFPTSLVLIRTTKRVTAGCVPNRQRRIWPVFNRLENRCQARAAPILETVSSWDTAAPPNMLACCVISSRGRRLPVSESENQLTRPRRRISPWSLFLRRRASGSDIDSCGQSREFALRASGYPGTYPGRAGCAACALR
jgi:hypothetical protein